MAMWVLMSSRHRTFKTDFHSAKHNYRGSLIRHIAVERALAFASKPATILWLHTKNDMAYKLLKLPFEIGFGLNMNFPVGDVFQFVVFYLSAQHRIVLRQIDSWLVKEKGNTKIPCYSEHTLS